MLVSFSMIPLDKGPHFSKYVARIIKLVKKSGLRYQLTPMDTIVEGEWTPVFRLINKCRKELLKDSKRISIRISVDENVGARDMLRTKVQSVEKELGYKRPYRRA